MLEVAAWSGPLGLLAPPGSGPTGPLVRHLPFPANVLAREAVVQMRSVFDCARDRNLAKPSPAASNKPLQALLNRHLNCWQGLPAGDLKCAAAGQEIREHPLVSCPPG